MATNSINVKKISVMLDKHKDTVFVDIKTPMVLSKESNTDDCDSDEVSMQITIAKGCGVEWAWKTFPGNDIHVIENGITKTLRFSIIPLTPIPLTKEEIDFGEKLADQLDIEIASNLLRG